jgi:hypothetical protein
MSVIIGTTTIAADSNTVELFAPLSSAAQVTLLYADNDIFIADAAGVTPPGTGEADMASNMAPLLLQQNPLQLNLTAGDTIYVGPYPDGGDVHVSYMITT